MASILVIIGVSVFLNFRYQSIVPAAVIAGMFFLFGTGISFAAFINKKFAAALFLIAYSAAVMLYPLNTMVLPGIEDSESSKSLSKELLKFYKEGERIGCERDYRAGVAFYTDKTPVEIVYSSTLYELMGSRERAWCVVKQKNMVDLNGPGVENPKEIFVVYKSGKKRLITNKPPGPAHSYVKH
jgi:hypothetical protein